MGNSSCVGHMALSESAVSHFLGWDFGPSLLKKRWGRGDGGGGHTAQPSRGHSKTGGGAKGGQDVKLSPESLPLSKKAGHALLKTHMGIFCSFNEAELPRCLQQP